MYPALKHRLINRNDGALDDDGLEVRYPFLLSLCLCACMGMCVRVFVIHPP